MKTLEDVMAEHPDLGANGFHTAESDREAKSGQGPTLENSRRTLAAYPNEFHRCVAWLQLRMQELKASGKTGRKWFWSGTEKLYCENSHFEVSGRCDSIDPKRRGVAICARPDGFGNGYVGNGAMIAAGLALGLPMKRDQKARFSVQFRLVD